jgi:NTE family protein
MPAAHSRPAVIEPRRTILVFQGGGALGAYQAGVFEALVESGRQPDWVVGTSIGAINAALIAGNPPKLRLPRVRAFWERMGTRESRATGLWPFSAGNLSLDNGLRSLSTLAFGLRGFFQPRHSLAFALDLPTEAEAASYYDVSPLRETLAELVDFDYLAESPVRLSVGAVDVESARLSYFDSKHGRLGPEHILASGALPPAFPPVKIAGRYFWDGGVYSNTPLEWILRDQPREHSLCLFATLWQNEDVAPRTLRGVLRRSKEIQFASRAEALIDMEEELHRLRHAVSLLTRALAEHAPESPLLDLFRLGCGSVFHVIQLEAPRLTGEDQSKDIEFDAHRVKLRWAAGRADTRRALRDRPWCVEVPPTQGIVVHDYTDHPRPRAR